MHDMKRLAGLIRELEEQLVVCMRCGMCQAVCPIYAETGREADVARGKLALLDGLGRELFKDPQGVDERLRRCLLCGACAANCPSGVKVLEVFLKARAILTGYRGLHPAKKVIFRGLLAHPKFFDSLLEWGARVQGIFVKPADDLLGTSCGRLLSPLKERHFKALAAVPFHQLGYPVTCGSGASGLNVAFFVGCVIDKVFPHVGQAVMQTMAHHGVGVYLPEDFACCGIPALAEGDITTFKRLLHYNLDRFSAQPFDFLITACATCTATIKKLWPLMAGDLPLDQRQQVAAIARKTMEVSQFLVDQGGAGRVADPDREETVVVTYHDPCHLKKSLGVARQPRALLQASPGYRFKEMVEADRCCGSGGSFNLQHYDLSAAIGRRKRDNIVQSGCQVLATTCPACMLQISDMLSQAGDHIRVKHVIELYAESLE